MPDAAPLPRQGDVFFDARGSGRVLRLSRHPDAGVVVLSIWNGGVCAATFRLPQDEVAAFIQALTSHFQPGAPAVPQTGQHVLPDQGAPTLP